MKEIKENIKKLLDSDEISNYKISKETGIAQTTLSDYATGKSKIGNMKLDHALKLNEFYNKNKEETKMTIETSKNVEGYNAEIKVGSGVLESLTRLLDNEEFAKSELEHEVVSVIDKLDMNEQLVEGTYEEELIFAVEDKLSASSYDSVTFNLELTIDDRGDVEGTVTK